MNEVEMKMYRNKGVVTDAWMKSLKHYLTVVVTLGDAGAEAYFKGQRFSAKRTRLISSIAPVAAMPLTPDTLYPGIWASIQDQSGYAAERAIRMALAAIDRGAFYRQPVDS